MPAPSLQSSAVRACIRHLPNIDSVGDIPYDVLRPVLKQIRNPEHLHQLEEKSPHIADADAELWRAFIARDVPNWQDKMIEPKNPRSWWKVYRKLVREEAQAKEEQEAKLKEAMKGLSKDRAEHRVGWIDKLMKDNEPLKPYLDGLPNPFAGSRGIVRKPAPKKTIISAMRAQSRQAVRTRDYNIGKAPAAVKKPALSSKNQIKAAPEWMVREQKRPPPPKLVPAIVPATASRPTALKPTAAITDRGSEQHTNDQTAMREARLRALTGQKAHATLSNMDNDTAKPQTRPERSRLQSSASTAVSPSQGANQPRLTVSPVHKSNVLPKAPIVRKRPAPSPLMPVKRRKV